MRSILLGCWTFLKFAKAPHRRLMTVKDIKFSTSSLHICKKEVAFSMQNDSGFKNSF